MALAASALAPGPAPCCREEAALPILTLCPVVRDDGAEARVRVVVALTVLSRPEAMRVLDVPGWF